MTLTKPIWHRAAVPLAIICLLTATDSLAAWTAGRAKNPVNGQTRCLLSSDTITFFDGYTDATARLIYDGETIAVVTDSDIDPAFSDLRLVVDDREPVLTDTVTGNTIAIFNNDIPAMLDQFAAGYNATALLRFWPTWPTVGSIPIEFSLIGFTKALREFESCQ